jgi:hypothetical protein
MKNFVIQNSDVQGVNGQFSLMGDKFVTWKWKRLTRSRVFPKTTFSPAGSFSTVSARRSAARSASPATSRERGRRRLKRDARAGKAESGRYDMMGMVGFKIMNKNIEENGEKFKWGDS